MPETAKTNEELAKEAFEHHCLALHGVKYAFEAMPANVRALWIDRATKQRDIFTKITGATVNG